MENVYSTIDLTINNNNKVAWLTLKRPPLNIMTIEMMEEIVKALSLINTNRDLHALVIRGEGKVFSAGVAVEDHVGDKAEPMLHLFHKIFHYLIEVSCPTIAVVNGAALGGGFELVSFCDIIVATEKAKFGQPEINLGLFPPVSAVTFPWITGFNRTMDLLLTGESIDAQKAYDWGFVTRLVLSEQLEKSLEQLLNNLTNKSPIALRIVKKAVCTAMASTFASAIGKVEQIYFRETLETHDAHEGMQAFIEKRMPTWENK